jgi:hypothetical protein
MSFWDAPGGTLFGPAGVPHLGIRRAELITGNAVSFAIRPQNSAAANPQLHELAGTEIGALAPFAKVVT